MEKEMEKDDSNVQRHATMVSSTCYKDQRSKMEREEEDDKD